MALSCYLAKLLCGFSGGSFCGSLSCAVSNNSCAISYGSFFNNGSNFFYYSSGVGSFSSLVRRTT